MTDYYTEDQTLTRLTSLTRPRLTSWVEAQAITPIQADTGPLYRAADLARLELLSDLSDLYNLDPEALAMLLTIIDQMHAARRDRAALLNAIRAEAAEVQTRIAAFLNARHAD